MQRSKADWKALRELIGISTGSLAALLHKNIATIQYWENPNESAVRYHPSDHAWEVLEDLRAKQINTVNKIVNLHVDKMNEAEARRGSDQNIPVAKLTYYRNRARYYGNKPEYGDIGILNATMRQAAMKLGEKGIPVEFEYDDETESEK